MLLIAVACGPVPRPTADPGMLQRSARAGEPITFDGSASRGSITSYTWDFGDGSPRVEEKATTHVYAANGDYSATLTVRGPGGAHSAGILINVVGCAATARISVVTQDPQPNATVIIGSSGSSGCMGAPLTAYEWDFGDGSMISGDASRATVSHTYSSANTYMVKLRVVDADGNEGRSTYALGVGVMTTSKPTISSCAANVSTAPIQRQVQFTAVASDPGGKPMTYAWTFSDSTSASGSTVLKSFATAGTYMATVVATTSDSRVSDPCTRTITITPPLDYSGTWILSPGSGNFSGTCPFSVSFPTASISIFHASNPDGGASELIVTPNGGTYPAGNELRGNEESPGNFVVTRNTPNENGTGACAMSLTTRHSLRLSFTSGMDVTGNWTKIYNAGQATCGCVAGGSVNGAFTGFKQ